LTASNWNSFRANGSRCLFFGRRKPAIELIGERLAVLSREIRWPTTDMAAAAQLVQEITHSEPLADIGFRVQLAAGIYRLGMFGDDLRRQRDVGGNDQIAGVCEFNNPPIRHVHSRGYQQTVDELGTRRVQALVRDERQFGFSPSCGPVEQLFDRRRAGVGVNPYLHGAISYVFLSGYPVIAGSAAAMI
jgi:hypothetical protein